MYNLRGRVFAPALILIIMPLGQEIQQQQQQQQQQFPLGAAIGAVGNIITTQLNNKAAKEREEKARAQNFMYNEKAADAADARTRSLYNDLYSPEAQMQQLKEAGLSPSIFASGGMAGKSGVSGAQGAGAVGIGPNVFAADPIGAAVATAGIAKTKAETANIQADTETKIVQNEINQINKEMTRLASEQYAKEFTLLNMNLMQGNDYVTYEKLAKDTNNYVEFWHKVKDATKYADSGIKSFINSEAGQQTLRAIYQSQTAFKHDIAILSSEEMNAEFQKQVALFLKNSNYAEMNAKAAVDQLKSLSAESELNATQKNAWNNLLDKMGDSTWKDIIIVLAQVLGQYAAKANISINTGNTNYNTTDNGNKVWNKWAVNTNEQ